MWRSTRNEGFGTFDFNAHLARQLGVLIRRIGTGRNGFRPATFRHRAPPSRPGLAGDATGARKKSSRTLLRRRPVRRRLFLETAALLSTAVSFYADRIRRPDAT